MRKLIGLVFLVSIGLLAGCGTDDSQKNMVESQKKIDEANAKLEGTKSDEGSQANP